MGPVNEVAMADSSIELDPRAILLDITPASKEDLVALLVNALKTCGTILDEKEAIKSVLAREAVRPTGLARGVACPHAKTGGVMKPCLAVARLLHPMDFQSSDGIPARHVFLILTPKDSTGNPHINILTSVVSCYRNPALIERLDRASSKDEYHTLLTGCPDDEA